MLNHLISIAQELLSFPTAPFREQNVSQCIQKFCKDRKIPFKLDSMGNLIAWTGKKKTAYPFAFVAHMDHPGFIIKSFKKGRANALFYGGWDPKEFSSAPVTVFSSNGPVSAEALKWGLSSKEKARSVELLVDKPVESGNIGMWSFDECRIKKGMLFSRSCDDGVGCVLLLSMLDIVSKEKNSPQVYGVFTVAEEAGLHGAKYLCKTGGLSQNVIPISVETSKELPNAKIGDGVVIRVGDSKSIFTPEISKFMVHVASELKAKSKDFNFQRKLMDGGQCEGSVFMNSGYLTGALCVPLGNYHNRNFANHKTEPEYVSLDDLRCANLLMVSMVTGTGVIGGFLKKKKPQYLIQTGSLGQKFLIENAGY